MPHPLITLLGRLGTLPERKDLIEWAAGSGDFWTAVAAHLRSRKPEEIAHEDRDDVKNFLNLSLYGVGPGAKNDPINVFLRLIGEERAKQGLAWKPPAARAQE